MAKKLPMADPSEMTFAPLGGESGLGAIELKLPEQVADVVSWILSPYRRKAVVVVSAPSGGGLLVDAASIASSHPDLSVYTVATGPLTHAFADLVPEGWQVYGGGARVYPAGVAMEGDPRRAPLFLVSKPADGPRVTGDLLKTLRPPSLSQNEDVKVVSSSDGPSETNTRIDTANAAVALARFLESSERNFPVVVVTNASGQRPFLDVDLIVSELEGVAGVYEVLHGAASWAFTGALPPRLGVFGGAARVYPADPDWLNDETQAPLFFCWDGKGARHITTRVIDAAYSAAGGQLQVLADSAGSRRVTATVKGLMGSHHVLLELDRGGQAVAVADAIWPGVPAERLVATGQQLAGVLAPGASHISRFTPDRAPSVELPANYVPGAVVLVKVATVNDDLARVALHPDLEVDLLADPEAADVASLVQTDEVVAVELMGSPGSLMARLADSEDDLVQGMAVIPDGPPWLRPEDLSVPEPEPDLEPEPPPQPVPAMPMPTPASAAIVAATQRERDFLASRLAELEDQFEKAKREAGLLRRKVREATQEAKRAKASFKAWEDRAQGRGVYGDPDRQLRHEIEVEYLYRIPEGQRSQTVLRDYGFGPRFLESVDNLQGISRDKVVEVMVEVLTDLAKDINGRELHQWRETVAGAQAVRDDGGAAWRVSLQVKTASARRMKYWLLPNGAIEFDFVGVHDDGL